MCCWSDRLCRSCILVLWRFNVQPNCDLNDDKPPLTFRNIMFGSMLCWVCHDLVCCLVFWLLLTVALCQISHLNTTNSTRRRDVGAQFYLLKTTLGGNTNALMSLRWSSAGFLSWMWLPSWLLLLSPLTSRPLPADRAEPTFSHTITNASPSLYSASRTTWTGRFQWCHNICSVGSANGLKL